MHDLSATLHHTPQDSPQVDRLLRVLQGSMSRDELQQALGLKGCKSFRERYLAPALAAGYIEMTLPDQPQSKSQQYRLTDSGAAARLKTNPQR